jgi:hypothetical protein
MASIKISMGFMRGLVRAAMLAAIAVGVMMVSSLIVIDFIHGNPHRSQQNAVFMMAVFAPIFAVVAFVGVVLVFGLSQYAQGRLVDLLVAKFGYSGIYGAIIIVPVAAILSWYCFDYLTPSNFNLGINEGPEWTPYQHGLTIRRYLITLAIQTALTLFTLLGLGLEIGPRRNAKRFLSLTLLTLATLTGLIWGYEAAKGQFQFL